MRKIVAALLFLATAAGWAQDRNVQGGKDLVSQEQPKVLYIVPWQAPQNPELTVHQPVADRTEDFKPLERDFYRQSLYFRQHLKMGILPDRQ